MVCIDLTQKDMCNLYNFHQKAFRQTHATHYKKQRHQITRFN